MSSSPQMRRYFTALRVYLLRSLIGLLGRTQINPDSFLARGARSFQYNLDGFDGTRLHGWVRCDLEPGSRTDLDVYVNQDFYGQFSACRFRPDIAAAHGTDGYHGFDISIHHPGAEIRSIRVVVPGYFSRDLGSLEGAWAGEWEEGKRCGFKSDLLAGGSEPPDRLTKRLTADSGLPDKLILTRRSVSAYVDHVRFLYRKEREFPVHVSEDAYRDYLRWYLTSESRTGKPPYLGPRELSYLNAASDIAPLPGLHLSNGTKLFLADYKTAFPAEADPVRQAENLLYWWCILKLQELNVCGLIPEPYIAFLTEKPSSHRPETRFLNTFVRHNFRDFPLDTAHPEERHLLMDRLLQVAGAVPQLRPLLPEEVLDLGLNATLQDFAKQSGPAEGPAKDSSRVPSVRLFGPLKKQSGLGQASRLSHALLSRNGFLCETQDVSDAFPSRDLDISLPAAAAAIATINLFHLNAEMIPDAARRFPQHAGSAYNIAYCFWELDKPAAAHLLGYELLDEVWVSSDFGKDALAGHIQARVTKVGLPCREVFRSPEAGRSILAALGVSGKTFKFICSFDALSYLQRKNPIGTIRAFQDAFVAGEDVALIVKTHSRQRAHDAFQDRLWEGIVEACKTDKRIYLFDKDLEQGALDSLTVSCDCLVSLHRAEAWGFGMMDAMSLGVPVIATAYSGNLEFCNPETAMLVDYDLVPVMDNDYAFAIPGARWAEPRHEVAVSALRSMFTNEAARRQLPSQAKTFVETHFSFEAIAEKYSRRLREIQNGHG